MGYAIAAQAPQRLFAGSIGVDFCPLAKLPVPPCPGNGGLRSTEQAPGTWLLQPLPALATPWTMLATGAACSASAGPAFGTVDNIAATELATRIEALARAPAAAPAQRGTAVDDLGLVELPAAAGASGVADDLFVVLLSGDGGWADIDREIGEQLNRAGLPVVGWNTLQYFWSRKSPDIASADLRRVLTHYRLQWGRPKVLLIGFSLGADVLPFMVSRLPADERARIRDMALLSLSHTVDFEFHVSDWLGRSEGETHEVAPELGKIGAPVLCIYGTGDDDTLCGEVKAPNVATVGLPGDHHYNGDFRAVTRLILERLRSH
jgi:type IV secretory pathway VirJ component